MLGWVMLMRLLLIGTLALTFILIYFMRPLQEMYRNKATDDWLLFSEQLVLLATDSAWSECRRQPAHFALFLPAAEFPTQPCRGRALLSALLAICHSSSGSSSSAWWVISTHCYKRNKKGNNKRKGTPWFLTPSCEIPANTDILLLTPNKPVIYVWILSVEQYCSVLTCGSNAFSVFCPAPWGKTLTTAWSHCCACCLLKWREQEGWELLKLLVSLPSPASDLVDKDSLGQAAIWGSQDFSSSSVKREFKRMLLLFFPFCKKHGNN